LRLVQKKLLIYPVPHALPPHWSPIPIPLPDFIREHESKFVFFDLFFNGCSNERPAVSNAVARFTGMHFGIVTNLADLIFSSSSGQHGAPQNLAAP